ncbi:extensin [Salmonella enterica subsp. arizonae]|uniref:Extensin n=1 Tax=Salmonella enterica subsp. arizonae TaxID=59203 RepID=A0A379T028_SALER|nr:extensin [Salmonella enterica subsp. arizonae]
MKGKGFLIIVLLGGIGGLGYCCLPSYYNPFSPLQLSDPPGWITTFQTTAPYAAAVPTTFDGGQSTGINFITTCGG